MSETVRAGIPTVYAGIEFRSRLEARWAAFFDVAGWRWSYEPFDADGYIPDFFIHGARPMLVEVKPFHQFDQWAPVIRRTRLALAGHWDQDILYLGLEPDVARHPFSADSGSCLGIMDERWWDDEQWGDSGARLVTCGYCGAKAVYHDEMSYACRPCGHHDGDHYLGRAWDWESAWAHATNTVKWAAK